MENQNNVITLFKTAQKGKTLSENAQTAFRIVFENNKLVVSNAKTAMNVLATSTHPVDQKLYTLFDAHIPADFFENRRSIKIKGFTPETSLESQVNTALEPPPPQVLKKVKSKQGEAKKTSSTFKVSDALLKNILTKLVQASTKVTEIEK